MAEQLLDWAYQNQRLDNREGMANDDSCFDQKATDSFIRRYLGGRVTPNKILVFTKRYLDADAGKTVQPTLDFERIRNHIKSIPYKAFLATTYWAAIAGFVKRRQGAKCQMCGSTDTLDVHHKTYSNHGDELHHTDDLVCLCHNCHANLHDKEK